MENIENYKEEDFELDIKRTLLENIGWYPGMIISTIFAFKSLKIAANINDMTIQLLALIVCIFATIRLFFWCGHPRICLKLKNIK